MKPAPEKRHGGRIALAMSAVVKAKENHEHYWKETTDLISVSRSGAGFYLERKCEIGRLVSLIFSMPRHMRAYDQEKELFRVWGLVQHSSRVTGDGELYHVGVAFIGRHVPASYHENPCQSYRIVGMQADGMWRVVEAKQDFVVRRHQRYWHSMPCVLSALDAEKNMISDDTAKTENISASGAAIYSTLDVNVGESVTFDSEGFEFSTLAMVRNRQDVEHQVPKIHIEFIDSLFPIDRLPNQFAEDSKNDDD